VDLTRIFSRRAAALEQEAAEASRRRAEAAPLVSELLALPAGRRPERVRRAARGKPARIAQTLLFASREAAEPDTGRVLAELALVAAQEIAAEQPAALVEELRAEVSCQIADCRRRSGDLAGSEEELGRAAAHLAGAVDSLERALFCRHLARLRRDQGRWDEALALFDRAADVAESQGATEEAAGSLAAKGEIELWLLDPDEALETLTYASSLVPVGPRRLALRVQQGIALAYAYLGRYAQAWMAVAFARRTFAPQEGSIEGLELTLLGGELAEGEGELEAAEKHFADAWRGLLRHREPHAAAIAGLHLARSTCGSAAAATCRAWWPRWPSSRSRRAYIPPSSPPSKPSARQPGKERPPSSSPASSPTT
ncbi:MAG TPA: hypothetical protein VOA87_05990, partial [Thermoanaerobaculia bacterium]|nr:hypothetical protein [Thermoanaerobaculia bacterium]